MHIERKIVGSGIELWECDWHYGADDSASKVWVKKVGAEQPLTPTQHEKAEAICWSYGRTLGNIAVFNQSVLGIFGADHGSDAILACDFVSAGKYRHGKDRWWCRTHQCHWGTKADIQATHVTGQMVCANARQPMCYVRNPMELDLNAHAEVGIWCSLPAALTSTGVVPQRQPRIHVHVRDVPGGHKSIDQDFPAITLVYDTKSDLFANDAISRVNLTPPAAFEFLLGICNNVVMGCISCNHCGYPHLDLGEFGRVPHRKHFCGNCGRDSTWSKIPISSTPLKPIHDLYPTAHTHITPDKCLNLDAFGSSVSFVAWASTPAVVWTAKRPQEHGIHVHVAESGKRIIDDTFGQVIHEGVALNREALLERMFNNTAA